MIDKLENLNETVFERIKRFNKIGQEYWSVRELFKVLEYQNGINF